MFNTPTGKPVAILYGWLALSALPFAFGMNCYDLEGEICCFNNGNWVCNPGILSSIVTSSSPTQIDSIEFHPSIVASAFHTLMDVVVIVLSTIASIVGCLCTAYVWYHRCRCVVDAFRNRENLDVEMTGIRG